MPKLDNNEMNPMSIPFKAPGKDFIPVLTSDGSPTLRGPTGEAMHSLEGALSETQFIYGPLARRVLNLNEPPRFLSLGLGLGYVEMMTVAIALHQEQNLSEFFLLSLESEVVLQEELKNFVSGNFDSAVPSLYTTILERVASSYGIAPIKLFKTLGKLLRGRQWRIEGALHLKSQWAEPKFNGIFFDAFSSKSSPDLWTEEFIRHFLSVFSARKCILNTYAATGRLKRALIEAGFHVERPKGFGKKRQCIMSTRDL